VKKSPLPILFVFVVVDLLGFSLILLLGTFAGFACFLILGLARSLVLVFASRILNGLLGGNISLAQAYITDVTDEKSRARSLGIIGAAFGIGFVIGPALGGLLSGFGYGVPALAASGLSLVNFAWIAAALPESLSAERRAARALIAALGRPRVGTRGCVGIVGMRRHHVGPHRREGRACLSRSVFSDHVLVARLADYPRRKALVEGE